MRIPPDGFAVTLVFKAEGLAMTRKHARRPWAGRTPPTTPRATNQATHQAAPQALGIDIGRVIISDGEGEGDTSFLGGSEADSLRTPPMKGALETIAELVEALEGRVWLVSKCGPSVQARTRRWLAQWRFYERTGLPSRQLRFCRQRHEKAPICAELGLCAFIDDRTDVLAPMAGIVPWRFLYGPQRHRAPGDVIWVRDWEAVRRELLPLCREGGRVMVEAAAPGTAAARGP
jgi:hypothetical protein